jgi:hypothetical protein
MEKREQSHIKKKKAGVKSKKKVTPVSKPVQQHISKNEMRDDNIDLDKKVTKARKWINEL